jgi:hypothetical protein
VTAFQVFPANHLEIGDGLHRIGCAARDVQTQGDNRRNGRAARLGSVLSPPHFVAPFPLFLDDAPAGSAPRLLRSSFSGSLEEALRTLEYKTNSGYLYVRFRTDQRTPCHLGLGMLHEFLTANQAELVDRCRSKVARRAVPAATDAELEHGPLAQLHERGNRSILKIPANSQEE